MIVITYYNIKDNMKQTLLSLFVLLVFSAPSAMAQGEVNMKFGKPAKEELQMTVYAPEPDAEAVVLCRLTDVSYTIQSSGYLVDYREKVRIKVLRPTGVRHATVTIPCLSNEQQKGTVSVMKRRLTLNAFGGGEMFNDDETGSATSTLSDNNAEETVEDLKATAYNLENGKVVKSRLKSSDVVTERVDDGLQQVRFTVPDVREGTVVEYEYCLHSGLFYQLHDWYAQCEIPVAYARLDMVIPAYLIYNIEEQGIQRLTGTCVTNSMRYKLESDPLAAPKVVNTNHYTYVGRGLKGLPKDDYVWALNSYCAGITAELKTFCLPTTMHMPYVTSWEQVDRILLEDPDLGAQQDDHSPLRDELTAAGVASVTDEQQRAAAVCQLVLGRVKWNGKYSLWPQNTKETVKQGGGSNADINMLLIQSLRDAGLKACPVVLRERDKGMLPYNFASLHKLTTFVVAVTLANGQLCCVDASSAGGYLNVLPEVLLVDRARLLSKDRVSPWVNLQQLSRSLVTTVVDGTLTADGVFKGTQTTLLRGNAALAHNRQKGHTQAFVPEVKEETTFERQCEVSGGTIRMSPFATPPMPVNPFSDVQRTIPVEFPSQKTHQIVVNITLPEGYQLVGQPEQVSAVTPDKGVSGRMMVSGVSGKVQVKYELNINKVAHADKNYDELRGIFDLLSKSSQQLLEISNKK